MNLLLPLLILVLSMAEPPADTIPMSSIRINDVLAMHQPVSEAIRLLGAPDRRRDFESPAFGPMTELYYGQSRLGFIDGVLQEFDIRDGRLFLIVPAGIVSVGDESAYLSEWFPAAYASRNFSSDINRYYLVLPLTDVLNGETYTMDLHITLVLHEDGRIDHIILEQPV